MLIYHRPASCAAWYEACTHVAEQLSGEIPEPYRTRTFPGIIGDIKALPPRKALSLVSRKHGLGNQYAYLYLTTGIDGGRGYQACAAEALGAVIGRDMEALRQARTLDVGCAVGVIGGILGLRGGVGLDLFRELLLTARAIDRETGHAGQYAVGDMTHPWPFAEGFDAVVCALVCHHLKRQEDTAAFFASANRCLRPGGRLLITLPAGSISSHGQLESLTAALESYGFSADRMKTGLVHSADDPRSLFWMFVLIAEKRGAAGTVFIDPGFGFERFKTPVTRVEKGARAQVTAGSVRKVRHERFRLMTIDDPRLIAEPDPLVYGTVARLAGTP